MDFKVKVSCEKCECSFELRPDSFKSRPSMECPNCGQAFPADVYEDLKAGVTALGNVPEFIGDGENSLDQGRFSVCIKSYGVMNNLFGDAND